MKCKYCNKPATIHITEIIEGSPQEFHLCDEHAREHIASGAVAPSKPKQPQEHMAALAAASSTGDLSRLDAQACPACGITFREFRQSGRLGCAHDYEAFKDELLPLIENIHGATQHCGKVPSGAPETIARTSQLLHLRRQLKEAIDREDYELAAEIRDKIRELEGEV